LQLSVVLSLSSHSYFFSPRSALLNVGGNAGVRIGHAVMTDADWKDDDVIVTSGDEGVLPRGLPVGIMKQRSADKRGVVLSTLGQAIDWVWVYPYEPVETPEQDPMIENDIATPAGAEMSSPLSPEDG